MEKKWSYQDFGIGVITGLALGAIAGVLLAPETGELTRERLAQGAGSLRMSAQELIENAKENLELAGRRLEGVFGAEEKSLRKRLGELKDELEKYNLNSSS